MKSEIIISSPVTDMELPANATVYEYISSKFSEYGEKPAITDTSSDRTINYNQLLDMIRRFGSSLIRMGFKKGDVFALYSPNLPEYAVAVLGIIAIGGIATTVNPLYTAEEVIKQLKLSGAQYIVGFPSNAANVIKAKETLNLKNAYVFGNAEGLTSFSTFFEDDGTLFLPDLSIHPDDVAFIPFSSGTTGLPKGVMLTHYNICSNMAQLMHPDFAVYKHDGPNLGLLPWYHIYGFVVIMAITLRAGGHLISMLRFDQEVFLKSIEKYKIKYANLVPPIYVLLSKSPMVKKFDLSALKESISGAAPLDAETSSTVNQRIGFGMTELSPASHLVRRMDGDSSQGSVGHCVPNTLAKIVDVETGESLGPGKDGELCIKGPQVMKGYFNNPEATANTIDKDGWLHTGDIGHYNEDKKFYIVDRLKELIKYKGFQVPPAELEGILLSNSKIADAAVIGIPDYEAGELPKAFVVKCDDITEEEVMDYVAIKVGPHKKLRGGVEFLEKIPKSASGKILRRELRKRESAKKKDN
ncbi:4-coumarate--CoA ligase [Trichoplax sp. H2]|nr:4-coumarate--CoA ligase [Trichoplax sp. H2]|eukprot:RDD41526.1 4-coumarate--CoA ligase [Trichoplax sp. H2]